MLSKRIVNLFFINLSFSIIAVSLFLIGFHSVDLSWNVLLFSHNENINLFDNYVDCGFSGKCSKYNDIYVKGQEETFISFLILILLTVFDFLAISTMLTEKQERNGSLPEIFEKFEKL